MRRTRRRTNGWLVKHGSEQRVPLVGRDGSLAQLSAAWRRGERCLSVVGPPGVGKTRLALEVYQQANRLLNLSPSSAFLCLLGGSTTAGEVVSKLADTLTVPGELRGSNAREGVVKWLAHGPGGLLVLDNAEQAVDVVAGLVAELRRRAPRYGVLVTSRIRLGLADETVITLAPLSVPAPDVSTPESVAASEGARLFMLFAELDGAPGPSDAAAIAHIVRRLEGLPLSLDLAARRLDTLSLAELDERLEDKFTILRDAYGSAATEPHDALWLTLEASWQLLDDWQCEALAQLALFRGEFSLGLAERVVVLHTGGGPMAPTVVDALQALVRHSLVVRLDDVGAASRFRLLETIREFAQRRGSSQVAEALWARYAVAVAEEGMGLAEAARGHGGDRALARLVRLGADLRAVVAGGATRPHTPPAVAARACYALSILLEHLGAHEERLEQLEAVLAALASEADDPALAVPRGHLLREVARTCYHLAQHGGGSRPGAPPSPSASSSGIGSCWRTPAATWASSSTSRVTRPPSVSSSRQERKRSASRTRASSWRAPPATSRTSWRIGATRGRLSPSCARVSRSPTASAGSP